MDQVTLAAQVRTVKGKGAARKIRKNNQVPGIFYGPKSEPVMLTINDPDLKRVLKQGSGENKLLDLQFQSDKGTETRRVMLKELLMDPIKGSFIHADFHEIDMNMELTVNVSVTLLNVPEGVDQGGVLQHIRRELSIACMPDKLVDSIELDVSALDIGDSLHIRDVKFPEGIRCLDEDHLTIAIVAAPTVSEEAEAEEEEEAAEDKVEASESEAEESSAS